uniref:Ig-like domain-containing protein n=1 Tax=Sus scrofa TaxID=9823 RepID=A0A8D1MXR0_PIG
MAISETNPRCGHPPELLVSGKEGPSWSQRLWGPRKVPGGWLRAEPHVRGWLGGRGSRTRTQSVRDSETWGPGGTRGSWGKQPLTQGSLSPGGSGKPSLLTPQGPVVASGQSLTLQCRSAISYDRFALAKEGARDLPQPPARQPQAGLSQAHFSLGEVRAHRATYRCHGSLSSDPHLLSHPSDPLELMVSGLHQKPSLLVQGGPMVRSGDNVTLSCSSQRAESRATTVQPKQTSLWIPGPQPTVGSIAATAPLVILPTGGWSQVTHCTFLSQVTPETVLRSDHM